MSSSRAKGLMDEAMDDNINSDLIELGCGMGIVASGSGLHPSTLISDVAPSDSTIVRVYSFLLDYFCIGGDGWARTQSSPPLE